MRILLFIFITGFSFHTFAQTQERPLTLTYIKMTTSPLLDSKENEIETLLSTALQLVKSTPLHNIGISESQEKPDFVIEITDSYSTADQLSKIKQQATQLDAYSFAIATEQGPLIILRILWDKIFYEEIPENSTSNRKALVARPDGFVRLLIALAHELYGNIPTTYRVVHSPSQRSRPESQAEYEAQAFRTSIEFIEKHLLQYQTHMNAQMRRQFEQALERERLMLQSWLPKSNLADTAIILPFSAARCQRYFTSVR